MDVESGIAPGRRNAPPGCAGDQSAIIGPFPCSRLVRNAAQLLHRADGCPVDEPFRVGARVRGIVRLYAARAGRVRQRSWSTW